MSHPIVQLNDVQAGKVIEREMNETEHEQYLQLQAESERHVEAVAAARAHRTAAWVKLAGLGLTDDEIAALLP